MPRLLNRLTYFLWGILAAFGAVLNETLYRKGLGWGDAWLLVFLPIQMLIGFSIWKLVSPGSGGPTLLVSIAVFSMSTLVMRSLVSQFLLGEALARGNLVALVGLAIAITAGHLWR